MNWIRRLFAPVEKSECKTCAVLKEQLEYEKAVNKEMLETLTSLLKPVPIINQPVGEPRPVSQRGKIWSRRKIELEKADKARATAPPSQHEAKPDDAVPQQTIIKPIRIDEGRKTIDQLELELGVVDSEHIDKPEEQGVH